jgi:NADH-quinone oxidoreductase subunit C
MEPLAIAEKIKNQFPAEVIEVVESRGQVGVIVAREQIGAMCRWLKDEPELRMDHLLALCGVDYVAKNGTYEVVYNLCSIPLRHMIRLRARVPADDCRIDSVTCLWRGADWLERECFDLLGIVFDGHPDLRRILLPEGWEGYPLRKTYPLRLPAEQEWQGYVQLKELSRELSRFDFYSDMLSNQAKAGANEAKK